MSDPVLQAAVAEARERLDAGDRETAQEILESVDVRPDTDPADRFAHGFLMGRIHGELAQWQEMDDALTAALDIAAGDLADLDRCKQLWYWMLVLPRDGQAWGFLERQCAAAAEFGRTAGSHSIRQMAAEFCAYAHRGMGKIDDARKGAVTILRRLERIGAPKERLQEWRDFLADLG